jgi:hypothetical protein
MGGNNKALQQELGILFGGVGFEVDLIINFAGILRADDNLAKIRDKAKPPAIPSANRAAQGGSKTWAAVAGPTGFWQTGCHRTS